MKKFDNILNSDIFRLFLGGLLICSTVGFGIIAGYLIFGIIGGLIGGLGTFMGFGALMDYTDIFDNFLGIENF